MRIKMTCEVEPKIKSNTLEGHYGEWKYYFTANEEGFLHKITIECSVPDHKKYQMRFDSFPTDEMPQGKAIVFELDHEFNDLLIDEFQFFEGMLSLVGNAVTISWQSPWIELIAETDEEKPHAIGGFRFQRIAKEEPYVLPENNVANMIMRAHFHSKVMNPFLAFFREAERERQAFRFINTFFNSYFVLEGAYGNKKYKNWQVREEFKKSPEFVRITQKVIDKFILKHDSIERKITKMLGELTDRHGNPVGAKLDVDGIAHLLVNTRGSLLHFSGDKDQSKGTPINHNEFEEIANVALRIAGETLWDFSSQIDEYVEKMRAENKENMDSTPE